jgi:pimeloyl-ACP methyl ester carboxylesterase
VPDSVNVREIVLDAADIELSALLAQPRAGSPRATVVALHGGGMRAEYFHARTVPGFSLLELGAELGFTVLSVDRPGYGLSAARLPEGQSLAGQAGTLQAALADFASRHEIGAGFFVVAHSFGGKLALTAAADQAGFLGLDISGCAERLAVDPDVARSPAGKAPRLLWGPLTLYPPSTFTKARTMVSTTPVKETWEITAWPGMFGRLAPKITSPVRFTFAEHERWWLLDEPALASLTGQLSASPRVTVERLPDAAHNISLGWAARPYHLRALAFAEECLVAQKLGTIDKAGSRV